MVKAVANYKTNKTRTMVNDTGTIELEITCWAMLTNHWEYYFTPEKRGDITKALVMGAATEIGDVSLSEVKEHVISFTANLNEVHAAEGWRWKDGLGVTG